MSMMPNTRVEVQARDGLSDYFDQLDKATQRQAGRDALHAGADPMVSAVKGGIHNVTGLLQSGVAARPGKGDRPGIVSLLIKSVSTANIWLHGSARKFYIDKKTGKKIYVKGFDSLTAKERARIEAKYMDKINSPYLVYYARMVEEGHAAPYHRGGPKVVQGYPFEAPGFDATVETAADAIEDKLAANVAAV